MTSQRHRAGQYAPIASFLKIFSSFLNSFNRLYFRHTFYMHFNTPVFEVCQKCYLHPDILKHFDVHFLVKTKLVPDHFVIINMKSKQFQKVKRKSNKKVRFLPFLSIYWSLPFLLVDTWFAKQNLYLISSILYSDEIILPN